MKGTSLLKYFKPGDALPTVEQTGLPNHAVCSANHAMERMLQKGMSKEKTQVAVTNINT